MIIIKFGGNHQVKMAEEGERSCSSGDLQQLVRTIVVDLISQEQNPRVETAATLSGNRFNSSDQEINNIFRIPRGGSHSSASTSARHNMNNSQTNVALNFNSRQNYGTSQPQRKRQEVRQQQPQPRKRNRGQSTDPHAKYIKDVYLLPDPTWATVPRREKKAFLQTHNLVVDAFVIDKRWDLKELTTQFHLLFSVVLDENPLEPIG